MSRTRSRTRVRFFDVTSDDGTTLRAWTNGIAGPTVLLCNGLGTNPYAWPSLLRDDCGLHVVSWNHRGVSGSARPADGRVDLDAYVEDAVAVMRHVGMERVPIVSWSAGVTVAFELAARYPEHVSGIFAAAGVPGNTFGTMLEPLHIPPPVAKQLMIGISRAGLFGGDVLAPIVKRIPWTPETANLVRMSHFISPNADTEQLRILLKEFFTTHPGWYATLALAVAKQSRVSLSSIDIPTSFVAGRFDILSGPRAMGRAAQRVPGSRYRVMDATHFITVEHPETILREIHDLVARSR